MKAFKKTQLAVALTALGFASAAVANEVIQIDPDGGGNSFISVDTLDWSPGGALAVATTGSVSDPAVGDTFDLYAHAQLATFNFGGSPVALGSGWSFIVGFEEEVVSVLGQTATFVTTGSGTNFFEIYYDPTPSYSSLEGTGYNSADSVLVLSGSILGGTQTSFSLDLTKWPFVPAASDPTFQDTDGSGGADLDQFGSNDWNGTVASRPTTDTVTGTGSSQTEISVLLTSVNAQFIQGISPATVVSFDLTLRSENSLPFETPDPSDCYYGAGGAITNTACTNANNILPSVGTVNGVGATLGTALGLPGNSSADDIMFATDARTTFEVQRVPVPAPLALLGVGIVALASVKRRWNRNG